MTINTAQIISLLRPGLKTVFGDYPMYPSQWTEIFERGTSDKEVEYDVEMKFLGQAQLRAEGASTVYDTMSQRFTYSYINRYVALGWIITRQAIQDNLYKARFPQQSQSLKRSFLQTKEVLGAAVLNNAFDGTNFPIGDAQALVATAHPIEGSTVANRDTSFADLNETSLESACIGVQGFRDAANLIVMVKPEKLIIPRQLVFVADRLLSSRFRPDSANNDINAINNLNMIPGGAVVNQFLTDTDAWFLKTDADNGFKYLQREAFETNMTTTFDEDNVKVRGLERYSFGVSNFRAVWASQGA